ncbi:DeoR/GlpR transcriptional regulator [Ideonella sp. B7]|nr:DeoR/GlpR transcriptional regulator [Ideonella benzenivorans]
MLQEERHQRIRALLANAELVTTERIALDLDVSRETVRRDVVALEALGALRRVHGGVQRTAALPEPPLQQRARAHLLEKRSIVRAAARLLQPGQTVFVDAGSTVSLLADELASLRGLTVITNSLDVAQKLVADDTAAQCRHTVRLLGGQPRPTTGATYGDETIAAILSRRADWAMLSPVGVSAELGASSYELHEAEVARAMSRQASQTVILADHSKIGQTSRVSFCPLERIERLITDPRAAKTPGYAALSRAGCSIVLA